MKKILLITLILSLTLLSGCKNNEESQKTELPTYTFDFENQSFTNGTYLIEEFENVLTQLIEKYETFDKYYSEEDHDSLYFEKDELVVKDLSYLIALEKAGYYNDLIVLIQDILVTVDAESLNEGDGYIDGYDKVYLYYDEGSFVIQKYKYDYDLFTRYMKTYMFQLIEDELYYEEITTWYDTSEEFDFDSFRVVQDRYYENHYYESVTYDDSTEAASYQYRSISDFSSFYYRAYRGVEVFGLNSDTGMHTITYFEDEIESKNLFYRVDSEFILGIDFNDDSSISYIRYNARFVEGWDKYDKYNKNIMYEDSIIVGPSDVSIYYTNPLNVTIYFVFLDQDSVTFDYSLQEYDLQFSEVTKSDIERDLLYLEDMNSDVLDLLDEYKDEDMSFYEFCKSRVLIQIDLGEYDE